MELETIDDKGHQLEKKVAIAWRRLVVAAEAEGHTITLTTAFRSPEHQKKLFSKYVKDIAAWERSGKRGPKPTPVARPGKSAHEFGRAVDIKVAAFPKLLEWLRKNASRFGFYETVSREAWHWEFRDG